MILHQCVVCRRYEGKAHHSPPPQPLPSFRVREAPPFTHCGVDFAGPLYIKETGQSLGSYKVWICLYSCEPSTWKLYPTCLLRSFKRFTAQRGVPIRVVSDNGKTFKSAAKLLTRILNHPEVQGYFAGMHIQWNFNLEKAPWLGGDL